MQIFEHKFYVDKAKSRRQACRLSRLFNAGCVKFCRKDALLGLVSTRPNYTITDAVGIHARPAGLLAKKSAEFKSKVTIIKGSKSADTRRLMALMGLGIKCGETITVQTEGEDEAAAEAIEAFLRENNF